MATMAGAILADLPDPATVQLWADAERIAHELHEAQRRIILDRRLLPDMLAWERLPRPTQNARIAAVVELLERDIIAGPEPT
ncbi:hypothetical protein [Micromonospora sp. NPDC023956]|uniref:hypothetical protein n=1 Tax=Micromonospora sp. NPDC023956 TaxID=3155722 RepID=UPI0034028E81